jgi:hypothetical protein
MNDLIDDIILMFYHYLQYYDKIALSCVNRAISHISQSVIRELQHDCDRLLKRVISGSYKDFGYDYRAIHEARYATLYMLIVSKDKEYFDLLMKIENKMPEYFITQNFDGYFELDRRHHKMYLGIQVSHKQLLEREHILGIKFDVVRSCSFKENCSCFSDMCYQIVSIY